MNFSYTFGKAIDNQSGRPGGHGSYGPTTSTAIDSNNMRLDRGRADFDQKHVAIVTWIYELPFGKGRPLMQSANRVVDAALGRLERARVHQLDVGRAILHFQWREDRAIRREFARRNRWFHAARRYTPARRAGSGLL